jgi:teichuronic acid biosynthesis glycosyltransferase TuaC
MNLLFLSNLFPDTLQPYRGLDNACLLHQLSDRCRIRVISPRASLPFQRRAAKICRPTDLTFQPAFLPAWYVPKVGSLFNHRLFTSAIRRPLLELKKEFDYEAILCSWVYPDACAVARLQSELKVPFVAIAQGSDVHAYLRMPLRCRIISKSMNTSSGVITRSAKLATLLKEAGVEAGKLHPVYNGVDLNLFQPGDKPAARRQLGLPDGPIVLFVGNFLPVKNPLLLIEAHAALCREYPSHLVMIGGGPMEQQVRRVADSRGFGKYVTLAGRQNAEKISVYMRAANVLCMSSHNEGVPNVILEAFASGLPVVSTDVGGISEVVKEPFLGTLVEQGNAPELTAALMKELKQQPATNRIRGHSLHFSWNRAADEYFAILQDAVAGNMARRRV